MARIAFRVDASAELGQGHLSRCLSLAARLRQQGADCRFVGSKAMQPWTASIESAGHRVNFIDPPAGTPEDAGQTVGILGGEPVDWLVVDHYGLDAQWHDLARPAARWMLAIDDLADRPLSADAVLDPSPCASAQAYAALVRAGCTLMLGTDYCLLREEFARARSDLARRHPEPVRIHLALGGTDHAGLTLPLARYLLEWFSTVQVLAVLGTHSPQAEALQSLGLEAGGRLRTVVATQDVAATMAECTCAVGAPGGTLWERFCMDLPTACLTTSPNQRAIIENLASEGWLLDLGDALDFPSRAQPLLREWLQAGSALQARSRELMAKVDGLGAQRVAAWMLERA